MTAARGFGTLFNPRPGSCLRSGEAATEGSHSGGPALMRGGIRAYEKAVEITPLGVPLIAFVPNAHLAHPA